MFDDGETIEDYALCLSGMVAHLTTLGDKVKDGEIVAKML
jgi:predicted deacylase